MAKNIKYQLFFGSNYGKEYRIDIYDEYSGDPIELTAGETPFVTSEQNSENIETALRPSTGTMQICTKVPAQSVEALGKEMLTIEDLMPSNSTERAVVLSHRSGRSWVVDWQGFVSCEVYNQDYTANPQNLEVPIISVIEAMDGIKLRYEDITDGLITIKTAIRMGLINITHAAGISLFERVYFPEVNYEILNKYINPSIMIEMSLHDNENRVDYIENGNSYKTILESVCKLMGWCAREQGKNIFFMPINHGDGDAKRMVWQEYSNFHSVDTFEPEGYENVAEIYLSDVEWRGNGHNKSIYQGKTFVEIIANIKKFDENLSLPSLPRGEFIHAVNDENMYVVNNYAYSRYSVHRCLQMNWSLLQDDMLETGRRITISKTYATNMYEGALQYINYFVLNIMYYDFPLYFVYYTNLLQNFPWYAMSFFARWKKFGTWEVPEGGTIEEYTPGEDVDGLVLYGIPDRHMWHTGTTYQDPNIYIQTEKTGDNDSIYIYKQITPNVFIMPDGILRMKMRCDYYDYCIWYVPLGLESDIRTVKGRKVSDRQDADLNDPAQLQIALQCGDKWWNGTEWVDSYARFWVAFDRESGEVELEIPVNPQIRGQVSVYLTPYMRGTLIYRAFDQSTQLDIDVHYPVSTMLITELSIDYEPEDDEWYMDRSTNNYFRILETNFHDGLSVHTDIASFNMNKRSPSIIIDSVTEEGFEFMKVLDYNLEEGGTEQRRPENDLLDRLAKWYGKVRRKLELEVAPLGVELPMLKLVADTEGGFDGKTYLPIAESVDWKAEVSTVTCLEDSDGDE